MLTKQCEWLEQLEAAHKSHQMHAQIREVTDKEQNGGVTTCIEDGDGNIIMEKDKILAIWHLYISELYNDNRGNMPEISTKNDLSPITRIEVEFALKVMPMKKVPGPDDMYTEMIVAAGEAGLTELTNL